MGQPCLRSFESQFCHLSCSQSYRLGGALKVTSPWPPKENPQFSSDWYWWVMVGLGRPHLCSVSLTGEIEKKYVASVGVRPTPWCSTAAEGPSSSTRETRWAGRSRQAETWLLASKPSVPLECLMSLQECASLARRSGTSVRTHPHRPGWQQSGC